MEMAEQPIQTIPQSLYLSFNNSDGCYEDWVPALKIKDWSELRILDLGSCGGYCVGDC